MSNQTPKRKYQVDYVPKGTKTHITEYVLADSPAAARVTMRLTRGFNKYEVKEVAA